MLSRILQRDSPGTTAVMGFTAIVLVAMIVTFPDKAFGASLQGLTVWWKIVFPALLPFLVLTEIFIAYGIVHGLGALLDPLMMRMFGASGSGGCVVAVGLAAGQPAGADLTVKLRNRQLLSQREGEWLLGLSHLSSPVYLTVVVAVGFFGRADLAALLIAVHWISALAAALLLRPKRRLDGGPKRTPSDRWNKSGQRRLPLLRRSVVAMLEAREEDGRSFGKVLGESVLHAVHTLMMIGGVMMIFSVLLEMISLTGLIRIIVHALSGPSAAAGMPDGLLSRIVTGWMEINLGAYEFGQGPPSGMIWTVAAASAMFAWGGLSAHAQVAGIIHGTDLRYRTFALFRIVHAILAVPAALLLWNPVNRVHSVLMERIPQAIPAAVNGPAVDGPPAGQWASFVPAAGFGFTLIVLMICVSLIIQFVTSKSQ